MQPHEPPRPNMAPVGGWRGSSYVLAYTALSVGGYCLLGTAASNLPTPWLLPVLWAVQGLLLTGFFSALHWCVHSSCFGAPWDRIFGAIWGTPLFINFSIFKAFHLWHHRHTGTEKDSQYQRTFVDFRSYISAFTAYRFVFVFSRWSIQALAGIHPYFTRSSQQRKAATVDAIILVVWLSAVGAVTAAVPMWMIIHYWMPWLFYLPCVFIVSVAEHYGCENSPDTARNTRTTRAGWLLRTVLWNVNFHGEHHLRPSAPFWTLRSLHSSLGGTIQNVAPSYLAVQREILRDIIDAKRFKNSRDDAKALARAEAYRLKNAEGGAD